MTPERFQALAASIRSRMNSAEMKGWSSVKRRIALGEALEDAALELKAEKRGALSTWLAANKLDKSKANRARKVYAHRALLMRQASVDKKAGRDPRPENVNEAIRMIDDHLARPELDIEEIKRKPKKRGRKPNPVGAWWRGVVVVRPSSRAAIN